MRENTFNKKVYRFQPFYVGQKEAIGITTALDIAEEKLSLYKSFLPEPLEMPAKPQIMFYVKHFRKVFPWPMRGFYEAAVCIRTQHPKSQEGWYILTMAVSSVVALKTGLMLGYPKYIPDSLTLESSGSEWIGKVVHHDKSPFTLRFSPAEVDVWWKDVYTKDAAFFLVDKKSNVNQMQAVISEVRRVIDKVKIDENQTGNVVLLIDPEEKWANLVPGSNISMPGILNKFKGKIYLSRKDRKPL